MCVQKKHKKKNKKTKCLGWTVAILFVVLVVLIVAAHMGLSAENSGAQAAEQGKAPGEKDLNMTQPDLDWEELPIEEDAYNDDMIVNISEQGDTVVVSTAFGQIRYPFAFSDVIRVVPVKYEDGAAFDFYGILEYGEYLLYTLWIGKDQGRPVGYVTDRSGEMQEVYFEIAEVPDNFKGTDRNTFYAAQETANDVLNTFITYS